MGQCFRQYTNWQTLDDVQLVLQQSLLTTEEWIKFYKSHPHVFQVDLVDSTTLLVKVLHPCLSPHFNKPQRKLYHLIHNIYPQSLQVSNKNDYMHIAPIRKLFHGQILTVFSGRRLHVWVDRHPSSWQHYIHLRLIVKDLYYDKTIFCQNTLKDSDEIEIND
jgi:hypothetical protein